MAELGKVGFREGLLGEGRWRLPLWYRDEASYVLDKPAGVALTGRPGETGSLTAGLRQQLGEEKPELGRLGIAGAWPVFGTERELTGLAWFAQEEASAERLRNVFGSRQGLFGYWLAARDVGDGKKNRREAAGTAGAEELPSGLDFVCPLPLALDRETGRMRVSHRSGKKALTGFRRVGELGDFGLWEAVVSFPRSDQVLVHALECGLLIPGESRYGREPELALPSRGGRGRGRVLYRGAAAEGTWLSWPEASREVRVERALSKAWTVAARRLGGAKGAESS